MSLWQLAAMVEGYNRANAGPGKPPPPTIDEHKARVERVKARLARPKT